ncbi:MAG: preprotein translocase subunit SecY [Candidatus Nealsonbacteria bacterium CG02_land_8_20_14_3_00_37_10]|uniref:Protein translocase subunit SecY n=2 Tax=Candidatus Nealsoniibacteriota TaxID=1817911 RepID=A0A2G9YZ13_9BACT|nr:MAG: preprotein translocase subunit SecY [Candidatus Nealsonbacteria bacterium CG23_combo_of_CG06-09_8_20_14_all_37_18]PIV45215.1 MAG: preprotein translocase subunit SecY [Candidatus Nealsonbacteria bacterium CG02_land_8_20_14_3_00_37_10]
MDWLKKIIQIFKISDLRNKILFILGIFAIFRLMANIPVPGISAEKMREFFEANQIFGLLNLFTGGALDNLSIVMLGLGPYITGVIIMQLLTMIFPALERMYKEEGEQGKKKFNQYGRILTVPLGFLQGYAMLSVFQRQGIIEALSPELIITSILTITAGTVFLMWLGELISEKGIGNGVSLLIFAGIVADIPNSIRQMLLTWDPAQIPSYLFFFGMALIIIAGVVLINEGRRNIPVSYAKRVRGTKMYGGASTYLPLNINPAGVIPIIFALSIMLFPGMIANFLGGAGGIVGTIAQGIGRAFQNMWFYGILYFLLVVLFTYFYTAVTFDPKAISSNLQKMGGFIPGIRPGESTANFMYYILNRVLLVGALFLGAIAVMPSIIGGITGVMVFRFLIGGTALLIVVSVVLDVMRQIKAQLQMREYETF